MCDIPRNEILRVHRQLVGKKIFIGTKVKKLSKKNLKILYTPGVGIVASFLEKQKKELKNYCLGKNTVAVISDGSAVLGLGNVGPEAALPVMEGKALLFKKLAHIDAFPIVLSTQNEEEIINTIKNISLCFGGINLEDISAPRCFTIEEKLQKLLDIPVVHDDQHATAIAVLAGLINALKLAKKNFNNIRIVISGSGAGGIGIVKLFLEYGIRNLIVLDSQGIISKNRKDLNEHKLWLANNTNFQNIKGDLKKALIGADVFIGVSKGGILKKEEIKLMKQKPIIFALANPIPEIMPQEAKEGGAFIYASGRSDFENQINNALIFPGLFRGALDHKVKRITFKMKIKAAENLAALVKKPDIKKIILSVFDKRVVKTVAKAIKS